MVEIKEVNGTRKAYVTGEMTIYNAKILKSQLAKAIEDLQDEVVIDLSQVSEIDTSGLQMLLMSRRKAAQQNKTLRLVALSTVVIEAIDLYNLHTFNDNPTAANGN